MLRTLRYRVPPVTTESVFQKKKVSSSLSFWGLVKQDSGGEEVDELVFNPTSWSRRAVVELPSDAARSPKHKKPRNETILQTSYDLKLLGNILFLNEWKVNVTKAVRKF